MNSKIGREVKLDLRMRRTKCKSLSGRTVTTNILGVAVDSRQVSEAVKGLCAVLNKNVLAPTGRKISFITNNNDDPIIQQKIANLLAQHHDDIVNERKFFRKLGVSLTARVTINDGGNCTLQQDLCAITATNGSPLFTGVERMGRTGTSLFTMHKKNLREGTATLQVPHTVLRRMLEPHSFNTLGLGNPPQPEPEYVAMRQ